MMNTGYDKGPERRQQTPETNNNPLSEMGKLTDRTHASVPKPKLSDTACSFPKALLPSGECDTAGRSSRRVLAR